MSVPPFVLPSLIGLCAGLICVGLFFLSHVRSRRSLQLSNRPAAPDLQMSPITPRIPLLLLLLSWPTLIFALLSSAVVGITACQVGFYPIYPAPLAGSFALTGPGKTTIVNGRSGSVQQILPFAGREAWSNVAPGPVAVAGPVEVNGLVYFTQEDPTTRGAIVTAYRLSDGSRLWSTPIGAAYPPVSNSFSPLRPLDSGYFPLVVADGLVYVEQIYQSRTDSTQGFALFSAVRADRGSVAWSLPLQRITAPQTQGWFLQMRGGAGVLLIIAYDGSISAWHATDGSVAWHLDASAFAGTSQVLRDRTSVMVDRTLYVWRRTSAGDEVLALRVTDGQRLWVHLLDGDWRNVNLLTHSETQVYLEVGSLLEDWDATTGKQLWVVLAEGSSFDSEARQADGVLYVTTGLLSNVTITLDAYNERDGSLIWRHTFAFADNAYLSLLDVSHHVLFVQSSEVLTNRHFHFVLCRGSNEPTSSLFAINASDGSIYWRNPSVNGWLFTPLDLQAG
ncbi:MAG TPA: PQQ-binding-like beta-propeller repeat protein [Ktedonobacteraceae bacterium]|nr:PQQ-binding-like beta-propeller repeat protein [Ktedonobacteraceae bacterium]